MATIIPLLIFFILNSIPIPSFSCPLYQKEALLHFKSSVLNIDRRSYFSDQYESWSPNSDCCSWKRVSCNKSGMIIELHLTSMIPSSGFDILTPLFHIRSLKLLDISITGLEGPIPRDGFGIGNLTELVRLEMWNNRFNGSIPDQFFELMNLRYLDMYGNMFEGNLGPEPGSFWNLNSSLQALNVSWNKLNGVLSPEVGKLRNLESLYLDNNDLTGSIPEEVGNLTKLWGFFVRRNRFSGRIPSSIGNMNALEVLDFSENLFSMQIPADIGRLPNIRRIDLNYNQLTGLIPSSIQNLSKLQELRLESNKLTGEIPIGLFQIRTLESLFIGGKGNKLIWNNKAKIVPRGNLTSLSMPYCGMSGQIPEWISSATSLKLLDLSGNQLEGRFPNWLAKMDLETIILSDNKLSGSIPPRLFESQSLEILQLSKNNFSGELPENIGNAKGVWILMLSKNNFSGRIPKSMSKMHNLGLLDLSRNKLSGDTFPIFTDNPDHYYLDLSYNEFFGKIPTALSRETQYIYLGGNKFSGSLPWNLTKLINLQHLDLHDNEITGNFHEVVFWSRILQVLVLRNNLLEGFIPRTISNFTNLQILDLSGNKLTGSIPSEIGNLTGMVDPPRSQLGWIFDGPSQFRLYINRYPIDLHLQDLIVNWKNYFHGLSSHFIDIYSLLDLSNNRISGEIPTSLGNLQSLKLLNISYNNISGYIPRSFGNLKSIESLDMSHNKISGSIPQSLAKLGELTILDVHNNKLTGKIPRGGQMDTMNEVKYFANNSGLCGMQIKITCPEDIAPPSSEGSEEAEDDEKLSWIFWVGTWIGFPVGFFSSILIMGYSLDFLRLFKIWGGFKCEPLFGCEREDYRERDTWRMTRLHVRSTADD
ncbi:hypothetical protein OSB04_011133 [Centaurea solstitialis]|uniref:Leucine-rich repeat-containing N-terminal plant-type domain-containing protein n=1 Tax=Centaurea solstitialis TaxID=347529 RepID=A0AA38WNT8_9ASTR|nr:hypothetical protein OSB04_011133 [Centaurea solstitialis]